MYETNKRLQGQVDDVDEIALTEPGCAPNTNTSLPGRDKRAVEGKTNDPTYNRCALVAMATTAKQYALPKSSETQLTPM